MLVLKTSSNTESISAPKAAPSMMVPSSKTRVASFIFIILSRQGGFAHQIAVTLARGATTFIDRPDHQALSATHISGGKDARQAGGKFSIFGFDIASFIARNIEGCQEGILGAEEAHRKQNQLRRVGLFRARDFARPEASVRIPDPFHLHSLNFLYVSLFIPDKTFGGHQIFAWIVTMDGFMFF